MQDKIQSSIESMQSLLKPKTTQSLSQKTQKLSQQASVISDTLRVLDRGLAEALLRDTDPKVEMKLNQAVLTQDKAYEVSVTKTAEQKIEDPFTEYITEKREALKPSSTFITAAQPILDIPTPDVPKTLESGKSTEKTTLSSVQPPMVSQIPVLAKSVKEESVTPLPVKEAFSQAQDAKDSQVTESKEAKEDQAALEKEPMVQQPVKQHPKEPISQPSLRDSIKEHHTTTVVQERSVERQMVSEELLPRESVRSLQIQKPLSQPVVEYRQIETRVSTDERRQLRETTDDRRHQRETTDEKRHQRETAEDISDKVLKALNTIPDQIASKLAPKDSRIKELEDELHNTRRQASQALQEALNESHRLAERCDHLQQQQHEQAMKLSRQSLEMKSLLEQNTTLREENRKLIDNELKLLDRLERPEKPLETNRERDGSYIVKKERLLAQLDEKIKWLQLKQEENKSPVLNGFIGHVKSLKHVVNLVGTGQTENDFLDLCDGLQGVLQSASQETHDLAQRMQQLDKRIERIRKDSDLVKSESALAVKKIKDKSASDNELFCKAKSELEHRMKLLQDQHDKLMTENAQMRDKIKQLDDRNKELQTIAEMPPPLPKVIKIPERREPLDKGGLELENSQLRDHIQQLEKTIDEWRQQNSQLQVLVQQKSTAEQETEQESLELRKRNAELKVLLDQEHVRAEKAGALVQSLRSELEQKPQQPLGLELDKLEQIFQDRVKGLQQTMNAPKTTEIADLLKLIQQKPAEEDLDQITDLIQGLGERLEILEQENSLLDEQKKRLKLKFKQKEQTWMEKVQKLRKEYDLVQIEGQQHQEILGQYREQFETLQKLKWADAEEAKEPYPFAVIAGRIHQQLMDLKQEMALMQQQQVHLNRTIDQKQSQVDSQTIATEQLAQEQLQKQEKIQILSDRVQSLLQEVQSLELQVKSANQSKQLAETKLKKIVTQYQKMMS